MFNLSQIISDYDVDKGSAKPGDGPPQGTAGSGKKNRTLKRRLAKSDLEAEPSQPLTTEIYESLDESGLPDFPPKPQSSAAGRADDADGAVSEHEYKTLGAGNDENGYAEKAYQQYLATHQQWSPLLAQSQMTAQDRLRQNVQESPVEISNAENRALLKKLNYMIHLLEEQQNERTNNLTEELILYIFLGIFVIFVVDSFTKVGKYTR